MVRAQFTKKLAERLENPHVPSAKLYAVTNRHKIKLRSSGYRLVYDVRDAELRCKDWRKDELLDIRRRGKISKVITSKN